MGPLVHHQAEQQQGEHQVTTASAPRTPLYIDVHLIHSTPYANLNRDRQGAPKTATYGGSLRPRLSSQNGRRHTRTHLQNALGVRAFRTRRTPQEVATRLIAQGWDADTALTRCPAPHHRGRHQGARSDHRGHECPVVPP
ncbi:type I-E CRISPR-associated protein Cas7/Cse4/CasC [Streptomyces decoyicus]|uniref:type I-E CRISPR-associated protein Cas7/Cse4/CasC n=1 Tax=Streptomyces decoyicus TaxID=249567 RepID=UPI003C12C54E